MQDTLDANPLITPERQRPWLAVDEWAQGRVADLPAKKSAAAVGVFAVIWNLVIGALAFLVWGRADLRSDMVVVVFVGLFGLAGLGLIALAAYLTVRGRKYGRAVFEMSSVPGVLGGWLRGIIRLPEEVPGGADGLVTLTCQRNATGQSRSSYDVWHADMPIVTASSVSVDVRIPFNLPESDLPHEAARESMRVTWLLSVKVDLPGVDYRATFRVPVFQTDASDTAFLAPDTEPARG